MAQYGVPRDRASAFRALQLEKSMGHVAVVTHAPKAAGPRRVMRLYAYLATVQVSASTGT
jgi:hypothetical protein